ncbi:MAG: glycine cleavage T C-terminal barrel domain-containing protein [Myxococcota bacterium]|nr:glycine cleavage T C-terminal barrel domain-containing protein [Myxococcota bacterium]
MSAETLCFRLPGRGLIQVSGSERTRWLDGMLTNDIQALEKGTPGAGCFALLLTRQGRVVADLHVLALEDELWLELEAGAVADVVERLDKMIIADDVRLRDARDAVERLAVEGPVAADVLARAGVDVAGLPADHFLEGAIAGVSVRVAAFAFTGALGFQLFVPPGGSDAIVDALGGAGAGAGSPETFERLRIEAGTPWLGRELDESVLPAEARLERAISTTKGCYTGQEVVARLRSRDRRNHVLVGLRFEAELAAPGTTLSDTAGKRIGEVTSSVDSPRFGAIGLGFVRHEHAEPGTAVGLEGAPDATVQALPFADGEPA